MIGLADIRAYNGDRQRNPFNCQHFNLNEIAVYLNGQLQHAVRTVQPDYGHALYIRAYNRMFAGTGKLCKDEGLYISREDYSDGCALYAFDLTADLGEEDHFSLVRQVSVRLSLKFSAVLANTVTAVAYAEFENVIEVDRDRNVVFDSRRSINTEGIDRILRRQCARDFDGVFSVDTLPDRPRLLVCDIDPSCRPGRHWVAICVKDGHGEYFDSFGRRPSAEFERYMNRHCRYWTFNDKQLQSVVSQFC